MLLHRHDFGSRTAVGIEDPDPVNIERKYYSFYNHQATSGELHWLTSNFAYFWTNNEDLNKALLNIALFELLNIDYGKSKGKKHGLLPEAQIRAAKLLQSIQITNFIVKDEEMDMHFYKFGYLEFETVDVAALPS